MNGIVVLARAGLSADSGPGAFRDLGDISSQVLLVEVATLLAHFVAPVRAHFVATVRAHFVATVRARRGEL